MKKRILVVSAGFIHPSIPARRGLSAILMARDRIGPTFISDIEELALLADDGFDGIVLYFHRRNISDEALVALDRFVAGGGGLLALHSASASFKKKPRYFDILGGRFVGHGKIEPYTVSRATGASPFFSVIEPFTVTDELYIHQYRDDVTIQYATETKAGSEPVVWTRGHGKGRVCYVSLGHVASVLRNDAVKGIISDALSFILKIGQGRTDG